MIKIRQIWENRHREEENQTETENHAYQYQPENTPARPEKLYLFQWLTEQCERTGAMFCGLYCLYKNNGQPGPGGEKEVEDYVGFLLFGKGEEWNNTDKHDYEIRGYLASSKPKTISGFCYRASIRQWLSSIPHGITNRLELAENVVSRGTGIRGSVLQEYR